MANDKTTTAAPGCAVADFPRRPEDWQAYALSPETRLMLANILANPAARAILADYLRKDEARDNLREWAETYDTTGDAAFTWKLVYERKTGTRKAKNLNYGRDILTARVVDTQGLERIKRHVYEMAKDTRRYVDEPVTTPWVYDPAKLIAALLKQVRGALRRCALDHETPAPAGLPPAAPGAERHEGNPLDIVEDGKRPLAAAAAAIVNEVRESVKNMAPAAEKATQAAPGTRGKGKGTRYAVPLKYAAWRMHMSVRQLQRILKGEAKKVPPLFNRELLNNKENFDRWADTAYAVPVFADDCGRDDGLTIKTGRGQRSTKRQKIAKEQTRLTAGGK